MHLNALLDLDVVAVESDDEINVMLELAAPARDADTARPPGCLQVVIDRSGSMHGERLDAAKRALHSVVDRLSPQDKFGVVAFDDHVHIAVPCAPLANRDLVHAQIEAIESRGTTNLSSGLVRGIEEARRAKSAHGATLALLSDGLANVGVTDHGSLASVAATARQHGVGISTIGIGLGYDEELLAAVARGGAGNTYFAQDGDEAGAALTTEVDDLLDEVAQAASLRIAASDEVESIRLYNDLPTSPAENGFVTELGDFYAGEERRVVLAVSVPAKPTLGLIEVAEIELRWTDVQTLESHTVTVPLHVNVVPGDEAANRIPDPVVRTEVAFQEAQESKRRAGEALRAGDAEGAASLFAEAGTMLSEAVADAPAAVTAEARHEAALLRSLALDAKQENPTVVAKRNAADRAQKNKGRRPS